MTSVAVVGGQPADGGQSLEERPLISALDHRLVGTRVILTVLKYRSGRRHEVTLTLTWQPLWGSWLLDRYEERPVPAER